MPTFLQIVSGEGEIRPLPEISDFVLSSLTTAPVSSPRRKIAKNPLTTIGIDYHVVGVFGGQSSGKSTMLNMLFGTTFETMAEDGQRKQTTKGAFLARSEFNCNSASGAQSPILVIDFEGTDGAERFEDQSLERQLSLFALSVADTLIVNMWSTEVGRFNAANLSLLRTVFEINLQLLEHLPNNSAKKLTLLFVIRDVVNNPDALFETVERDMTRVWSEMTKPEALTNTLLRDVFNVQYCALSHYVFCRDKFVSQVSTLRASFCDAESDARAFMAAECIRSIPLEGLPLYMENCWTSIKERKELDIPSQRDMLAQCRCLEFVEVLTQRLAESCKTKKEEISSGRRIKFLSSILETERDELLQEYRDETQLYSRRVVAKHQGDLFKALGAEIDRLALFQSTILVADELKRMETAIQRIVPDAVHELGKAAVNAAHDPAPSHSKKGGVPHDPHALRVRQFYERIVDGIEQVVCGLEKQLLQSEAEVDPNSAAAVLRSDPRMRDMSMKLLRQGVISGVEQRLDSMAMDANTFMGKLFDETLTMDPATGQMRVFHTEKQLTAAFAPARYAGLLLLSCLYARRMRPRATPEADVMAQMLQVGGPRESIAPKYPSDAVVTTRRVSSSDLSAVASTVPAVVVVMSEQQVTHKYELFNQYTQHAFLMQRTNIERGNTHLPPWVYLAFLLLGANEAYYVATSPVLLIFVVLIGYFFFKHAVLQMWNQFEESAPPQVVLPLKAMITVVGSLIPHRQAAPSAAPATAAAAAPAAPTASAAAAAAPAAAPAAAAAAEANGKKTPTASAAAEDDKKKKKKQ